jgi:hypothetical protein
MTNEHPPGPLPELKAQAKRLRRSLSESGHEISHSQSLELLARQYGMRDWNTLHAAAGNRLRLQAGHRVRGRYLGQPFTGRIKGLTLLGDGARRRVSLQFDTPVDVVRFDSFSSLRRQVSGVVGWDGRSDSRTSDGTPHLVIEPVPEHP